MWERMHSSAMMRALGLKPGAHLPTMGLARRDVEGVTVYVKPVPPREIWDHGKSSAHRVIAICPACERHLSAGRLVQHWEHCPKREK
jgi:hypothetical protein